MTEVVFNEVVEVKYSAQQNDSLTDSFRNFYKLEKFPKISRVLIVTKDSYMKFLRARIKERTPFEQSSEEMPLSFDEQSLPFEIVETKTYFDMPKSGTITLHEILDSPNGLTKEVRMIQSLQQDFGITNFNKYFEAELDVLKRFLEEIK